MVPGFAVPWQLMNNYGAANYPGIGQSEWNTCFACSNALDACTKVAGSPNATDQFSAYRSEWSGFLSIRSTYCNLHDLVHLRMQ